MCRLLPEPYSPPSLGTLLRTGESAVTQIQTLYFHLFSKQYYLLYRCSIFARLANILRKWRKFRWGFFRQLTAEKLTYERRRVYCCNWKVMLHRKQDRFVFSNYNVWFVTGFVIFFTRFVESFPFLESIKLRFPGSLTTRGNGGKAGSYLFDVWLKVGFSKQQFLQRK